jgi:hypothetical protein
MTLPKQRTGHEKALIAEYFTVGWNILEGIIAIAAGATAGSIALVGFGLDSFVEVTSGLVLIWRLRKHGFDDEEEEVAERKAILVVGITFLLLAVYVTYAARIALQSCLVAIGTESRLESCTKQG